jgi:hypothetical protein
MKRPSPRHPLKEVKRSAWHASIALEHAVTRSRLVTRRLPCVTTARLRCTMCGARWTVRLGKRKPWRRCPRGCNTHLLSKH